MWFCLDRTKFGSDQESLFSSSGTQINCDRGAVASRRARIADQFSLTSKSKKSIFQVSIIKIFLSGDNLYGGAKNCWNTIGHQSNEFWVIVIIPCPFSSFTVQPSRYHASSTMCTPVRVEKFGWSRVNRVICQTRRVFRFIHSFTPSACGIGWRQKVLREDESFRRKRIKVSDACRMSNHFMTIRDS